MNVYKLTTEQKDFLTGKKWDGETFFNPVLDADGNWFISIEEVNGCNSIEWIKNLPLIPYNPIIVEMI